MAVSEKMGDEGQTKREDEIMARYLLRGGKMLSATCPSCGCPLFEIKGKSLCVVCTERDTEKKGFGVAGPRPASPEEPEEKEGMIRFGGRIREPLERAIISLCERAAHEEDPMRAKILMEAVQAGMDAYQRLAGKPYQR